MNQLENPAPETLTASHFAPYRGGAFSIEGFAHQLRLREIIEGAGGDSFRAPFTLIFAGPRGDILSEGLRRVVSDDGAAFDLYLIPIQTPDPGRQDYQAAFN
jgi:hypothetical protein